MPYANRVDKQNHNRQYYKTHPRDNREQSKKWQRAHSKNRIARFVGCDGEGFTNATGYHAYNMLRLGDLLLVPNKGEVRLRTESCLEAISLLDPTNIYVGYFFDYDVTKILEDVDFYKLRRLTHPGERRGRDGRTFPVDWRRYQLDYLPKKFFKVRRMTGQVSHDENGREIPVWGPWITINDVGTFFQTKFTNALEDWDIATPEIRDAIRGMKNLRGSFTREEFDKVAEYNRQECLYLEQLMEKFRDTCIDLDLIPSQWQGPGQLVEALLEKNGFPKTKDVPFLNSSENADALKYGLYAYYGGRFETSIIGHIQKPVFQYDINSAYPYAMMSVPCLQHGRFREENGYRAQDATYSEPMALCYGSFDATEPASYYGLPMRRKDGSIYFPAKGGGWYWSFEIQAAIHQRFTAEKVFVYSTHCDCKPLGFIEEMYNQRRALGKTSKGLAIKLVMNSVYGKMAQAIGEPKYSNPIYASYLTAKCRTQCQEFLHQLNTCVPGKRCGGDVLMIATDSVAVVHKNKHVKPSKKLGDWDLEVHNDGMFIIQSGMYFGSSDKAKDREGGGAKTRGIPSDFLDDKTKAKFHEAFKALQKDGDFKKAGVKVPRQVFMGIKIAIMRKNTKLLGQWIHDEQLITFNCLTKRSPKITFTAMGASFMHTGPILFDQEETTPYSKDIGGLIRRQFEERDAIMEAQPDWAPIQDREFRGEF